MNYRIFWRCDACAATIVLLVQLVTRTALCAQSLDNDLTLDAHGDDGGVGWDLEYAESIPKDALNVMLAPSHWNALDWSIAGGLAGAGLALYASDGRINAWTQRHRNTRTDALAKDIMPFGSTYIIYELGALGVASAFIPDHRVTRTALLGGESVAFAMLGYEALQFAANRVRPSQGANRDTWRGPHWPITGHSFPSGHATAAFAVATVVADEWKDVPGIAPLAYTLAAGVGLARMDVNAHWATDVFTGALIGWSMGTVVEHSHTRLMRHATIAPILDGRCEGISFLWHL